MELAGRLEREGASYEPSPPSQGSGQEGARLTELDEDATLADYLAYGARANPGLEAAFNRWAAALERIPQARALPDPTLGFGYFVQEVETRVGPQRAKLGVSQMLPWTGKRALRGEAALHKAEAAHARYEAAKLSLFYRIRRAYWEYWYLSRAIAITEENLRLVAQLEGVARAKYAAGLAPQSAVTKAQVELGRLEDRLTALRDMRGPGSAELDAAIGRRPGAALPWPKESPPENRGGIDYDALAALLDESSPELAAADAIIDNEESNVALARKGALPDVGVGLDYTFTGESAMAGSDSGKDIVAMLSVSLPLGRAKYRAAEREAQARLAAARLDRADRENALSASLKAALFGFRDAERRTELYGNTLLAKARQALDVARQSFEAGKADFLDVIDAQRTLLEFDLAQERARASRAVSLAEIEMLVGTEIAGAGPLIKRSASKAGANGGALEEDR